MPYTVNVPYSSLESQQGTCPNFIPTTTEQWAVMKADVCADMLPATLEEYNQDLLASYRKAQADAVQQSDPKYQKKRRLSISESALLGLKDIDWRATHLDEEATKAEQKYIYSWEYGSMDYKQFVWGATFALQDTDNGIHGGNSKYSVSNSEFCKGTNTKYKAVLRQCASNKKVGESNVYFDVWAEVEQISSTLYFNTLTQMVEQDAKEVNLDDLYTNSYCLFLREVGTMVTAAGQKDFVVLLKGYLHRHGRYLNPWLDAISKVPMLSPEQFLDKHGFNPDRMCEYLMGVSGDAQQRWFTLQMVAVLKRSFQPGCKHDHMLVLISPEKGRGKTTFLELLTDTSNSKYNSTEEPSRKYYVQKQVIGSDKSFAEALRGKLVLNIDECDSAFRGAKGSVLKEALTNSTDNYRVPYSLACSDFPRTVVFFGTSNHPTLIQDQAGDRRWLLIDVAKDIDTTWLKANWDDFWGYYKHLHNSGYQTWLDRDEQNTLLQVQATHKVREPWFDALDGILDLVEGKDAGHCLSTAIRPSDLLMVLGTEMDSKKRYSADIVKDYLVNERGYSVGRPRLADGTQKSTPLPYLMGTDGNPKLLSRAELTEAYSRYTTAICRMSKALPKAP